MRPARRAMHWITLGRRRASAFGPLRRATTPAPSGILEACGVAPGWHCLEVGGGGGTIVEWLSPARWADRARPGDRPDTRFWKRSTSRIWRSAATISPRIPSRRRVRPRACAHGDLPPARARTSAAADGGRAQARWLAGLRGDRQHLHVPGFPVRCGQRRAFMKIRDAITNAMAARGHSTAMGANSTAALARPGSWRSGAEGRVLLRHAGAGAELERLTIEQLRDEIIASGGRPRRKSRRAWRWSIAQRSWRWHTR